MRLWIVLAASCLLLSACAEFRLPGTASVQQRAPMKIDPTAWASYQAYLALIGETGQGVFAITTDGAGSGSWLCTAALCSKVNEYPARAITRCEELNPGYRCVVLAVNRTPQINFTPPQ